MNSPEVVVYTVAWCPHCVRILSFLGTIGIPFVNYDVDSDEARWREALSLTGGVDMVPVLKIGQETRFGVFDSAFQDWIKNRIPGVTP